MNESNKKRIADINSGIISEGYKKTKVGIVPVEWEVEQIGKYLVEYKEKSTENNQYPVLTSSRKGLMLQTDYFKDRQVTTENNTGYNIIPYGYLTFRSRTDDGRFVFNKNTIIDKGIISYFYPVFSFKKKVNTTFMLELLNFSIYHRFMPFVEGTAQQVLSLKKLGNLIYAIPPFPEQQKIAEILSTQDKLIELQEKKIEQLKELKKAYLQKMFPQKGSKYPELRFKGFTDPWEQRKVGDVLSESRDAGHSGDIAKKLTVKLWGKGVYAKNDKGSAATQYFTRHAGQFIYSKLDFLNSAFGVIPQELESYESTADLPAFDCIAVDPYFMFYRAIQPSFYLTNGMIADGSRKARRIHVETFLDMPLDLPSIEEQKKVASYFTQLDSLITLHQRKSEQEKQKKKALMQLLLTGKVRCI